LTEVVVENITKQFRGLSILENVNFKVRSGEVAVILGPSGAGKTTLLRIIAGTESPDQGRIYFDGEDVTNKPPKERDIGMVFQTFALYPHMTVYDNIASPLRAKKTSEVEIRKRVHEIAELLGIQHILNKRPQECSGGEAQRVVIARALVKNPKICLFDEPLTNLDYKVREVLRIEIKRLFKQLKITAIYSTPNPEEAAALGETLIHLRNGRVIQTGMVRECFKYPKDVEAAACYSPYGVNILEATCLKQERGKVLKVNDKLFIDVGNYSEIVEGEEYLIGIYPHDIFPTEAGLKNVLRIPITVDFLENTGSELIINMRVGDKVLRMLSTEVERIHEFEQLQYVYVPLENIIIFKKSDESRVCNLGVNA